VSRLLAAGLTAGAVLWAVLIVASPVALHAAAAASPASVVYVASSRICHQRPDRSFIVASFQMPVCARCAGLYLSAALGSPLAWRRRRQRFGSAPAPLLLVAALPTAITFGLETTGLMPFSNLARAIAALPLGAVGGWLFVRMLVDTPLRYDSLLDAPKNADS
jgi:uncharacterized membrane protein